MSETNTALEVLSRVLRTTLSDLELRQVPPAPNLQERLDDTSSQEDFRRARTLSHEEGIPFWHSVFRLGAWSEVGVSDAVLKAALYSQATDHYAYVSCDGSFAARAAAAIEAAPTEVYIVASSSVQTAGGTRHIPMLDFSVKERWPGALATAVGAIRALGIPGTVLASGRSFHFIGDELATWDEYSAFLCRALLLAPIVDERWIAHQLLAGRATLRVSPNSHGLVPREVARVV